VSKKLRVNGILLAAGASKRFGGDKLTVTLESGKTIGVQSYETLVRIIPKTTVVIRSKDHKTERMFLNVGAKVTYCAKASEGLSQSLIAGIKASVNCDAWIVALADMPFVSYKTIVLIRNKLLNGSPLSIPVYNGKLGNPVGISKVFKPQILKLTGDKGARNLIQERATERDMILTDDGGIMTDIDTEVDYKRLKKCGLKP